MKKNPYQVFGIVFTAVAGVELAVLLVLACILEGGGTAMFIVGLVLGIQILVFGGIGLGFLLHTRRRRLERERLIADGCREMADVIETERVMNIQINGRCPYRVVCHIKRDGVLHEYRSDLLRDNPALPAGSRVPVYLDRYDEKRYFVDVESVMPTIVRH